MIRWLIGACCAAVLCGFALPQRLAAQEADAKTQEFNAKSKALAERIDKIIEDRLAKHKIQPGAITDDGVYVRRLYIDLAGRIPELLEASGFIDPTNDTPDKRTAEVDKLLAKDLYARNFAHYWRSLMLTENPNNFQGAGLRPSFEAWLRQKLESNTGYDVMVRELLTANPVFNGGGMNNATPAAFYFGNENKAENLAGATSRIFLGVKIECAQCHPHPFAKWKQTQFWEYAAFFGGMQQFQPGRGGQQPVNQFSREIKIPDSGKVVQAKFLDGKQPQWKDGVPTRTTLADWITAPENPYFARAAVDHVWSYFFGVSLLEPIMEPSDDSPPAHPELLDEMAREFTAQGYNLKFLIRAIVLTKAYQRVSIAMSEKTKDQVQLFAMMPVRGMTPEQFFDSLAEVTGYAKREPAVNPQQFNQPFGPRSPRQEFLSRFSSQDKRSETQTSILQALLMMNGKFIAELTTPTRECNESLWTIATRETPEKAVITLHKLVLSRMPRPEEQARLQQYIERGGATGDRSQAVADVYWALLNSAEFMLNH
jgi:hypothetical protein